jgi:thiol-disulfide isomerase/thioredoxin
MKFQMENKALHLQHPKKSPFVQSLFAPVSMKLLIASVIVSVFCFALPVHGNGYEIHFKVNGLQDTSVILGHRFAASLRADDTVWVDQNGQGVFKGDKELRGGMYFLFLNGEVVFFFLDKDQQFSMETSLGDLQGNLTFKGSEMNSAWSAYNAEVAKINQEKEALLASKENATDAEKKAIDESLKNLGEKFNSAKQKTINKNRHNFLGVFLQATEEVKVPDPPKDGQGNIIDSLFQYRYYRNHFFDNFDVSDARLLYSPIYEDKIKRYLDKVVPQVPDTIIKEADWLIGLSRSDSILFQYMTSTLLNHYAKSEIMGMDAVYLHIAEKYYIPEANWTSEKFIEDLKKTVAKQKPLVLGKVAPDIQMVHVPSEHFKMAKTDTALKKNVYVGSFFNLHQIKADFTVLYFWESDCGHCRKSVPKLHANLEKLTELGTVVVAVHMAGGVEGKVDWTDFLNTHEIYNWINAWNPYSLDYKDKYDLKASNQVFILDKDKKIIAKRISTEQVEDVIKMFNQREKQK